MKRILLLLIGFTAIVNAYTYNSQLMQIYAKIAPRMVLMAETPKKTPAENIDICILYEEGDDPSAKTLRNLMHSIYPNGLSGQMLNVTLAHYSRYRSCEKASLLFLLDTDNSTIRPSLDFATKHHILTMAYSSRLLSEGVILSIHLGKTVRPYLNVETAVKNGIIPNNLLIRISKIYSKGEE